MRHEILKRDLKAMEKNAKELIKLIDEGANTYVITNPKLCLIRDLANKNPLYLALFRMFSNHVMQGDTQTGRRLLEQFLSALRDYYPNIQTSNT